MYCAHTIHMIRDSCAVPKTSDVTTEVIVASKICEKQ